MNVMARPELDVVLTSSPVDGASIDSLAARVYSHPRHDINAEDIQDCDILLSFISGHLIHHNPD
jgi:hypothetical protein